MSKLYKTARGKLIDIDKIKLSNENTLTVGNMKTNANGDLLGANNQVIASRNQIMDQVFAVESASPASYSPNDPANFDRRQKLIEANNARELSDLANNLIVPVVPEDKTPAVIPAARGSLASSVASATTVTQKPELTPQQQKKSNGPSRI